MMGLLEQLRESSY